MSRRHHHHPTNEIANALIHERGVVLVERLKDLVRKPRGYLPERCCEEFNDPEYRNQWLYVSLSRNEHLER